MSQELATTGSYKLLTQPEDEIRKAIRYSLEEMQISPWDLDSVRTPAGGQLQFEIQSSNGTDYAKEIRGVILVVRGQRVYFQSALDEGRAAPDCVSFDLATGFGDPGGKCMECPLNQFGSAVKGDGKACSERTNVYMLVEGRRLPIALRIPPSSKQSVKKYVVSLWNQELDPYQVETAWTLEKTRNQGGIEFARWSPRIGNRLPPELAERAKVYREAFLPIFENEIGPPLTTPAATTATD